MVELVPVFVYLIVIDVVLCYLSFDEPICDMVEIGAKSYYIVFVIFGLIISGMYGLADFSYYSSIIIGLCF